MNININAKDIDFDKHLIVDIRTQEEIEEFSLEDTLLYPIDFNTADEETIKKDFDELIKNNSKTLVIMCRSGARSAFLCEFLNQKEKIALNLSGGIIAMCQNYPDKVKN